MKLQELFLTERSVLSVQGQYDSTYVDVFVATGLDLTSLEGSPVTVTRSAGVSYNKLRSLAGAPTTVKDTFDCSHNKLASLEGGPSQVDYDYYCEDNLLVTLKGAPKSVHSFHCQNNLLKNLDGIPSEIRGRLDCRANRLKSLKGIHKLIHTIGENADFSKNPIESHILGLLRIKELKYVELYNRPVMIIINKHLKGDRDIFACQEELISEGFESFAQL